MPNHSPAPRSLTTLQDLHAQALQRLSEQFPEAAAQLTAFAASQANSSQTEKTENTAHATQQAQLVSSLTVEEHRAVLQKLAELTTLPTQKLETDQQLYLEQQLSDLLGFSVVSQHHLVTLSPSIGVVSARPHLKRSPTDTLLQHTDVLAAGMQQSRSALGWFDGTREVYGVSLPFTCFPNWPQQFTEYLRWCKQAKILLVNPHEQVAVVCGVSDIFVPHTAKFQFGASPETIRAGKCWSKSAAGKISLFLIDDVADEVPFGPVSLAISQGSR